MDGATFPLEVRSGAATATQLARARLIAAEYPGVCFPEQIEQCGRDERGRRIHGCRCMAEAMESGSG